MTQQYQNEPTIVVFDLDGTITRYDTYVRFLSFVIYRSPLKLFRLPALAIDVLRHKFGRQTNSWLKIRFLSAILAGMDRNTIDSLAASFSRRVIISGVHSDAIECVKQYQDNGHELVLVSASLDIYVEPLGEMLGFKHIICTRTCWENDVLGNTLDGENCYGDVKIERIQRWLMNRADDRILAAYGDHESDFPLLKIADRGIVVNPDQKLRLKAKNSNLEVIDWN
ncbi:MAG: HAD-IB family hydrolase [Gammaproteobacteria bacterium]|nr:MAG: HAD-IB family hydrolase [Gammaproteobacteria bacterium]